MNFFCVSAFNQIKTKHTLDYTFMCALFWNIWNNWPYLKSIILNTGYKWNNYTSICLYWTGSISRIYILVAQYLFKAIMTAHPLPMWRVDLYQLRDAYIAALALSLLNRTGRQDEIACGCGYRQGEHLPTTVMAKPELIWEKII